MAGTALPVLIKTFESRPFGWTIIISCFAIPAIITTLCMFFMLQPGIVPFAIPDTVERVDKNTPPAFLAAASQDPVVPMSNSLQFA